MYFLHDDSKVDKLLQKFRLAGAIEVSSKIFFNKKDDN
jgi:hypothetical protein